jgi:IS30 family transposase
MTHLSQEQRYSISQMKRQGMKQSKIATIIGVSQVTISKELSRNRNSLGHYVAKDAQMFADMRKQRFAHQRKFSKKMESFIREKIEKHQWSPEQIKGYAVNEGFSMVSVERIYQFIRADKAAGGVLYKHCRHKLKHRKRTIYGNAGVKNIANRISIHQRPLEVENRQEMGHWEMDLIQNGKDFILTLVERKSRYLLMEKLPNGKQADGVAKTVCRLLKPYQKYVKTITTDNGSEFAKHQLINQKLKTKVYFTDPYSSWQKGTIENTNKLIRQYIPKNESIKNLSFNDLIKIQFKINNRPRKNLHFNSPSAIFYNFAS